MGLGAILGELLTNSFVKRQLGSTPGFAAKAILELDMELTARGVELAFAR